MSLKRGKTASVNFLMTVTFGSETLEKILKIQFYDSLQSSGATVDFNFESLIFKFNRNAMVETGKVIFYN